MIIKLQRVGEVSKIMFQVFYIIWEVQYYCLEVAYNRINMNILISYITTKKRIQRNTA